MTKSLACEAILSEEVRITAGLAADDLPQQEVAIRGRGEPMIVRSVTDAKMLPKLVNDVEIVAA
jgi:adenylate cyclase